jgi:hypothetical protein
MKIQNAKGMGFLILLITLTVPCFVFAQISWVRQNIDVDFDGARSVYAADIDGDTHMDVVGAAFNADDIVWWQNDGDENFTKYTIADNFDGATSVFAVDLDDDGDVDVLGAAYNADDITWWENDGNENFTEHTIEGNFNGASSVFATDINGDGNIDVVGTAQIAGDVLWWENDGNENFTEHVITDNLSNAYNVYAADFDNDNDTDVVVAIYSSVGSDNITWWENTNVLGTNWTKHLVIDGYFQATSVYATDLDSDNDNDILAVAGTGRPVLWWKNDGSGNFAQDTISDAIGMGTDVCALDIDDDNDVDIVSTSAYTINWWENDGDENFTRHLIAQALSQVKSVFAIDVDGDTDIDILTAIEGADDIVWWKSSLITEHNVGPLTIDIPDTVPYDTTLQPQVTVKNFGLNTEIFNMTCTIDPGAYHSSIPAIYLPSDENLQVTFPTPFTFDEGGSYTVTVSTNLDGDENPANDTLEKIIEVPVVLDVGPISIDIPESVPMDTTLYPAGTVKNFGSVTIEGFPVTCEIQPGNYTSTRTISDLAPGDSLQFSFFTEFTFESGNYTVTMYSRLTDDENPVNDTLEKIVEAYDPGVAEGHMELPDVFEFTAPTISRRHTEIKLALPVATKVDIVVYDALGRLSKNLISKRFSAGIYTIPANIDLPAGVYFYKLNASSGENVIKKFLIVE